MDSDIHRRLQKALVEINTSARHQKRQLITRYPELWDEIKLTYPVTEKSKASEIIYVVKNDIKENPGCQECGKAIDRLGHRKPLRKILF